MSRIRCPNCGSVGDVGDPRRSRQCRWCDQTLPDVEAARPVETPELERHAERDRVIFWGILGVVGVLCLLGAGSAESQLLAMVAVPTTGLWLLYLGIHWAVTGRRSRRPLAAFFLSLALVLLTVVGFVILVLITCSQMHIA